MVKSIYFLQYNILAFVHTRLRKTHFPNPANNKMVPFHFAGYIHWSVAVLAVEHVIFHPIDHLSWNSLNRKVRRQAFKGKNELLLGRVSHLSFEYRSSCRLPSLIVFYCE